jgi:hypothetical protein
MSLALGFWPVLRSLIICLRIPLIVAAQAQGTGFWAVAIFPSAKCMEGLHLINLLRNKVIN